MTVTATLARVAAATTLLIGCSSCAMGRIPAQRYGGPVEPMFIAFDKPELHLYHEFSSALRDSARIIVRDSAEFDGLWRRIEGPGSLSRPRVDFAKSMVIIAVLGRRPYEADFIRIDSLVARNGAIELSVLRFVVPVRGCGGFASTYTAPIDVVIAPRVDSEVHFVDKRIVVAGCDALADPRSWP